MSLGQSPKLPNQNGRDEEEASSQEEGKPLHEVQGGRVERVEDAGGHQHAKVIHTGHSRKESTCKERNITLWSLKDIGSNPGTTTLQLNWDTSLNLSSLTLLTCKAYIMCCDKVSMRSFMGSTWHTGTMKQMAVVKSMHEKYM